MHISLFTKQVAKITKQTSTVIQKKQRKLNYENLTKYYRLLQNLQKQFTVEL